MMKQSHQHPGYIFLISILAIGAIASATSLSLLLLGWAAEQNGLLLVQSTQAFEYAQTCADRAIHSLRTDLAYAGDETVELTDGSCYIRAVGGGGNEDRYVCVEGYAGDAKRRLQIHIDAVFPIAAINDWREVSDFSVCP